MAVQSKTLPFFKSGTQKQVLKNIIQFLDAYQIYHNVDNDNIYWKK